MKENDVICVSIEESDKYELSNYGFVRNKYTKKEKSFTYIKNNKYKAGFTSIKSALRQGFNRYFNGYF